MRIIIVHAQRSPAWGRQAGIVMLLLASLLCVPATRAMAAAPDPMTPTQLLYERERLQGLMTPRPGHLSTLDVMQGFQPVVPMLRRGPVPTVMPIAIGLISSAFGVRIDPITRSRAFHEGQDFAAPFGTPILAAASGIVIDARIHPEYGQMIDIDHGNELVTRYAHASVLLVKRGDLVRRGQQIALVGSTGRSTGAHLHFEVRTAGVAVDPVRFLGDQARPATLATAIGGR